jgi:hypothetical protein
MGVLQWIAYGLAGIFVAAIWLVGGAVISALVSIAGVILVGVSVVGFIAFAIKDYGDSKKNSP